MKLKHLLLLITTLVSSVASANGTAHFQAALRIKNERAVHNEAKVLESLRLSHEQNSLHPSLTGNLNHLLDDIREMKREIEAGVLEMTEQEHQAFYATCFQYYGLTEKLYEANHGFRGLIQSVSIDQLNQLRLVVPVAAGRILQNRLAEQNIHNRVPPFYTLLTLEPVPGHADQTYIEFSPEMRRRLMLQSFTIMPSNQMAHDTLRLMGISLSYGQFANIQSYLYPEEKLNVRLPSYISADDRDFIQGLQEDAFNMANETNYRPAFRDHVVPVLSEMVTLKSSDPNHFHTQYETDLVTLLPTITTTFVGHLDPQKAANTHVNSILKYDYWRGRIFFHVLHAKISASPTYFHLLEGDALVAALKELAISTEKDQLLMLIGCRYFVDVAGPSSTCNENGTVAPRVFEASNNWTPDELRRLNAMVQEVLERNYENIPTSLIDQLRHLRSGLDSVGIARRRYKSAALLIEGARVLGRIDEMYKEIANTPETVVNFDYLNDPIVMAGNIRPGQVVFAAAKAGYLDLNRRADQPYNSSEDLNKPWVAQILAKIIAKSSADDVTPEGRRRLGQTLGVLPNTGNVTTIFDDFSRNFNAITGPLLAGSGTSLSGQRISESAGRDCNGFFAFVTCFDVWTSRINAAIADLSTAALNPSARRMIIRNGIVDEIYGVYRSQNPESFRSIDERLRDVRQFLNAPPNVANAESNRFIDAFLQLLAFSDENTLGPELREQITGVFNALMAPGEEVDILPLVRLITDVDRMKQLVNSHGPFSDLLEAAFAEPAERNRLLWPFLQRKAVFLKYLELFIESLEDKFPGLFFEMPLHSEIARVAGNEFGVPLYKVINGLKDIVNNPLIKEPIAAAIESLDGGSEQRTAENLAEVKVAHLPMVSLLGAAAGHLTDQSDFSLNLYRRIFGSVQAYKDDNWWPRDLKTRDLMPSVRDQYRLSDCDTAQDPAECRRQAKIHRVLVTAFLKPYYTSAAFSKKRSIERLADFSQSFDRAMLQSASIIAIREAIGDRGNTGLEGLRAQTLHWDDWLKETDALLGTVNRQIFGFMLTTQTSGLQAGFSGSANRLLGVGMLVPGLGQLAVQAALARQYYLNYLSLAPFATAGMTTGDLVQGRDLRAALNSFHGELDTIAKSAPMLAAMTLTMTSNLLTPDAPGTGPDRGPNRFHAEDPTGRAQARAAQRATARQSRQVLQVAENETDPNVIRDAYRRQAARFHPDVNHSPDANQRFAEIRNAYDSLLNEVGPPTRSARPRNARPGEAIAQDFDMLRVPHSERNPNTIRDAYLREANAITDDTPTANARRVDLDGAYRRIMMRIENEAAQAAANAARPATASPSRPAAQGRNTPAAAEPQRQAPAPRGARAFIQRYFRSPFRRASGPTGELNPQQQQALWDLDIPQGANRAAAENIRRAVQDQIMDAQLRNEGNISRLQNRITELRARLAAPRAANGTTSLLEDDPDFIRLNLEQTEADLAAEQARTNLLRDARANADHAWEQVDSYYRTAGNNSVTPVTAQNPSYNDWVEGMQELGVEPGETLADAQMRYNDRLHRIPGYLNGESDPAQVQQVQTAWNRTQNYFDRLSHWGLNRNDMRVPAWLTPQAITPEARRIEPAAPAAAPTR